VGVMGKKQLIIEQIIVKIIEIGIIEFKALTKVEVTKKMGISLLITGHISGPPTR
jgi:hypothetical protein